MKKLLSMSLVACMTMMMVALFSGAAQAETVKMVGTVKSFKFSDDQKTVTAVVKDNKTEKDVVIIITDETTVTKFKEHVIKNGDEIRSTFEQNGDTNKAKVFKKTAGC